ncbi:MAG: hypothetical protein ACLPSW_04695 [Roseiarcus sp.]
MDAQAAHARAVREPPRPQRGQARFTSEAAEIAAGAAREDSREDSQTAAQRSPGATAIHPFVFKLVGAFALWFLLAIWSFVADPRSEYLLAVVTGFVLAVAALQSILRLVWRKTHAPTPESRVTFAEWAAGQFEIQTGRMRGGEAAIEVLLPFAAAAIAMTGFLVVVTLAR